MEKIMINYYKMWNKLYKIEDIINHLENLKVGDSFEEDELVYVKRVLSKCKKMIKDMELKYELIK